MVSPPITLLVVTLKRVNAFFALHPSTVGSSSTYNPIDYVGVRERTVVKPCGLYVDNRRLVPVPGRLEVQEWQAASSVRGETSERLIANLKPLKFTQVKINV